MHEMLNLEEIPKFTTPLESDPQYELVVKLSEVSYFKFYFLYLISSFQLAIDIDQEVNVIHKFVKDKYQKRFPELETFVHMPVDFLRTVKVLGNNIDIKSQNSKVLDAVLPPASRVIISVTGANSLFSNSLLTFQFLASTTQGKPLDESELQIVMEGCEMAEKLYEERLYINQFVEMRMTLIAPNRKLNSF